VEEFHPLFLLKYLFDNSSTQIEEHLGAVGVTFSHDELAQIEEILTAILPS